MKLKMVLGVEGVKPPAWGQRPHSPFFQLMMSTYLLYAFQNNVGIGNPQAIVANINHD